MNEEKIKERLIKLISEQKETLEEIKNKQGIKKEWETVIALINKKLENIKEKNIEEIIRDLEEINEISKKLTQKEIESKISIWIWFIIGIGVIILFNLIK